MENPSKRLRKKYPLYGLQQKRFHELHVILGQHLSKNCPYLELSWSVFSPNSGNYGP